MKVFLDDIRDPPTEDWTIARSAGKAMGLIAHHWKEITHISLDHDLGDSENGSGYDVISYIEKALILGWLKDNPETIPEITSHSMNPIGRSNIERVIRRIRERLMEK